MNKTNDEDKRTQWIEKGGDPRWFDVFMLTGQDVCALVQAGSSRDIMGKKIFDHAEVEKILKNKRVR